MKQLHVKLHSLWNAARLVARRRTRAFEHRLAISVLAAVIVASSSSAADVTVMNLNNDGAGSLR